MRTLAGWAAAASTGCGYLLYPERKGRRSGSIDVPVLVVDLLWLLPGIVPGVVCLIVDYTTGCIYTRERHASKGRDAPPVTLTKGVAVVELEGKVVAASRETTKGRLALGWGPEHPPVDELVLKAELRIGDPSRGRSSSAPMRDFVHPVPGSR